MQEYHFDVTRVHDCLWYVNSLKLYLTSWVFLPNKCLSTTKLTAEEKRTAHYDVCFESRMSIITGVSESVQMLSIFLKSKGTPGFCKEFRPVSGGRNKEPVAQFATRQPDQVVYISWNFHLFPYLVRNFDSRTCILAVHLSLGLSGTLASDRQHCLCGIPSIRLQWTITRRMRGFIHGENLVARKGLYIAKNISAVKNTNSPESGSSFIFN